MSPDTLPVAVIGGGIAGLATAHELTSRDRAGQRPVSVTLFEAGPTCGGNLQTIQEHGYRVEAGPNGFLDSEPATLQLINNVGLQSRLLRSEDAARRRFLWSYGKLEEIPTRPGAFLRSDLLSWRGKLRVAAEILVRARRFPAGEPGGKNTQLEPGEDETVFAFGARRFGVEFAETMLDPMVKGISGGDARRISLAAAFPRMVELERQHGSLFKAMFRIARERKQTGDAAPSGGPSGVLHSFRGGMSDLPRYLERQLTMELDGNRILTGTPVTEVVPKATATGGSWHIEAGGSQHGPFAAVIDASPAHAACRHHRSVDLRNLLQGISYSPMAVICCAFDRDQVSHSFDGFGMLIPSREHRRLLGVLWTSSIFHNRAPAGRILLRCMAGGRKSVELSDSELVRMACGELADFHDLTAAPEHTWVFRHERAIAQYEVGHLDRLTAIERELADVPGLFLAGSSYRGIAINHCVVDAGKTATTVLKWLDSRY